MPRTKTWKAAERAISKRTNGKRVPVTGCHVQALADGETTAPDIAHSLWAMEVKHRKEIPQWLHDAMRQAERSRAGDQVAIVILHEAGQRYDKSYVVVRLKDWVELHGNVEKEA